MIKPVILIALGGVVVALAITLNFVISDDDGTQVTGQRPPTQTATQSSVGTSTGDDDQRSTSTIRPSFDVVRINPAGDAVIAGRAEPGTVVEIFDGDKKIGEARADGRGEWVFVPSTPLPPGGRTLSLRSTNPNGIVSTSIANVILVVPEKGKDIAGRPSETPSAPLALKVIREGRGAPEVLQKPTPQPVAKTAPTKDEPGSATQALTVEVVEYDDKGLLDISGRAEKGGLVHLYLDDKFLGRVESGPRNLWRSSPKEPAPAGMHKLRADLVNPAGEVQSRIEVVFARSVPLTDVPPGTLVVVEPGNSLWRIARQTYGSGFRYTVIYEANKRQIRDVDLIFPGQVFSLPSIN